MKFVPQVAHETRIDRNQAMNLTCPLKAWGLSDRGVQRSALLALVPAQSRTFHRLTPRLD